MDDRDGSTAAGRRLGIGLMVVSALAFSTAGVFTRAAPVGLWPMVFWRNLFGAAGLGFVFAIRRAWGPAAPLGRRGWMAILCSAGATICYLAAFTRTTVADVSVIYAAAPIITAALAWAALGERPEHRTLAAAAAALAGVSLVVAGSAAAGTFAGDGLALAMTLALSAVAVLARGAPLPPWLTAFGSAVLSGLAVLPIVLVNGINLRIGLGDAVWLATFGGVTMTLALPASLAGTARVPAGRAMLIASIELPLAPLWVWLADGEVPSVTTVLGGGIVLAAVATDLFAPRNGKRAPKRPRPASIVS